MKLYNKTSIPNELIEPLLIQAGIQSGCKTTKVYLKLQQRNSTYSIGVSGKAHNYTGINDYYLTGNSKRMLVCDGYITMMIPNVSALNKKYKHDFLRLSEDIYSVAVHEFTHIKDYQKRITSSYKNKTKPYKNRPCEILARKVAKRSMNHLNDKRQDLILNLAVWLDNKHNTSNHVTRQNKYFTCANPNCNYDHLWLYKKIPYYIKSGLWNPCKCGEKSIVQCVDINNRTPIVNGLVFKSVH